MQQVNYSEKITERVKERAKSWLREGICKGRCLLEAARGYALLKKSCGVKNRKQEPL